VLIVPRLLALVIALPVLSFLSPWRRLFGGLLVAWIYGRHQSRQFSWPAAHDPQAQHLPGRHDQGAVHGAGIG
jgi:ABC-type transporter Mla maintaining outer membrane lipid asymmetry permease subunit MlaE